MPWRGRIERGALFRIPNFSKEYTQHALKRGLVFFFHKLIQKKKRGPLLASLHLHGRDSGREREQPARPSQQQPTVPPPVPCTPQPANAAALCIAVPLFQITSSRVRDLHPDGEVVAIAGGASLGVLVLWPWEWPWGRPWRRPRAEALLHLNHFEPFFICPAPRAHGGDDGNIRFSEQACRREGTSWFHHRSCLVQVDFL